MTRFPPPRALSLVSDSDEYARWDAAYVLGSLSSADRHEFEAHLRPCPSCRESVGELSGMPALLAQLDRDDVAAIDDGESGRAAPAAVDVAAGKGGPAAAPFASDDMDRRWPPRRPRCWRSVCWSRSNRIRRRRLRCRRRPSPRRQ